MEYTFGKSKKKIKVKKNLKLKKKTSHKLNLKKY